MDSESKPSAVAPLAQEPKSPGDSPSGLPELPSLLTHPLGLEGWAPYEPVLLAALASEDPLLLIGPHGSAKSFLLERLAGALELEFRFYNASLINFDDLVGIPVPAEDRKSLEYIGTTSSIWGAEVVFIDEINRTKPELQNKLFPIINERRVQGVDLEKLRFRWSAMNPAPAADSEDESLDVYLGAEPLDPALADRFVYIIEVPGWHQLTDAQRRAVLADQFRGVHEFPVPPADLVQRTRNRLQGLRKNPPPAVIDYQLCLTDYLHQQQIDFSTRRASMIYRNILAVHAAREMLYTTAFPSLEARQVDWATSAITALRFSLPQVALGKAPGDLHLLAAHRHAWEVANLDVLNPLHEIGLISDPFERCLRAFDAADYLVGHDFGAMVLEAVQKADSPELQRVRALAFYLALQRRRPLPAHIMEVLSAPLDRWLDHQDGSFRVRVEVEDAIDCAVKELKECAPECAALFKEYAVTLLAGFSGGADPVTCAVAANHFAELWNRLKLADQFSATLHNVA